MSRIRRLGHYGCAVNSTAVPVPSRFVSHTIPAIRQPGIQAVGSVDRIATWCRRGEERRSPSDSQWGANGCPCVPSVCLSSVRVRGDVGFLGERSRDPLCTWRASPRRSWSGGGDARRPGPSGASTCSQLVRPGPPARALCSSLQLSSPPRSPVFLHSKNVFSQVNRQPWITAVHDFKIL